MLVLLDIVIGVSFVYLLLALMCTTTNEWIASARGLRARALEDGIRQLLGPLADDFYRHPLIAALSRPGTRPSYVPAHIFSSTVLDLLGRHGDGAAPAQHVRAGLAALKTKAPVASNEHAAHAAALEDWFNASMDRVSGQYKRQLQVITVAVAAVVTLAANADTLQIIGVLWRSPTLRASVLDQARRRAQGPKPVDASYPDVTNPVPPVAEDASAEDADANGVTPAERATLDQLVGWSSDFRRVNAGVCANLQQERDRACGDASASAACQQVLQRISADNRCRIDATDLIATDAAPGKAFLSGALLPVAASHTFGWLLTIIAISLGAAFWFDTLNRFINIRGAGPAPHEKNKGARA